RATAMLIGPGFGTEDTTREFIENLLAGKSGIKKSSSSIGFVHSAGDEKKDEENRSLPPLVVDADGLRLLSQIKEWQSKLPAVSILTPHPGEMSALTGLPKEEIQEDRQAIASKFAKDW